MKSNVAVKKNQNSLERERKIKKVKTEPRKPKYRNSFLQIED